MLTSSSETKKIKGKLLFKVVPHLSHPEDIWTDIKVQMRTSTSAASVSSSLQKPLMPPCFCNFVPQWTPKQVDFP
jgi:hypothetical protein